MSGSRCSGQAILPLQSPDPGGAWLTVWQFQAIAELRPGETCGMLHQFSQNLPAKVDEAHLYSSIITVTDSETDGLFHQQAFAI